MFAIFLLTTALAQDPPPPAPGLAPERELVTPQEHQRIENMLSRYAGAKLKGQSLEQDVRFRLFKDEDEEAEPQDGTEGPHEFHFHATIPKETDAIAVKLDSAEPLGPKRYRLAAKVIVPMERMGGHYKFHGLGEILRRPVGWTIDDVRAEIEIAATMDVGWKTLENGHIGIFPGGFLDEALNEEERKKARLIERLNVRIRKLDLSTVNMDGVLGRQSFMRNGQPTVRGPLRFVLSQTQQGQFSVAMQLAINRAIRENEAAILEGVNQFIGDQLPETQLVVTNFLEKLAIQSNLIGKKPLGLKKPDTPPPPKPSPMPKGGPL